MTDLSSLAASLTEATDKLVDHVCDKLEAKLGRELSGRDLPLEVRRAIDASTALRAFLTKKGEK